MYRERLNLDFNQIWDIRRWLYEWELEIALGVDKDAPPSGEHLFYSAIGCFQELFNRKPFSYDDLMAICNKYYQSQGKGYDVSNCLDDQEFGLALLASMSFGYELDQKIPTTIDIKYGSTLEELEAELPGMFQGEKVIRAILAKDLKSKWISEVVPGHFARGRLGFELSGNDNYDGFSNDDEMFCRMLANQKPGEIAAVMNLERFRVYRNLKNYFRKFDKHPRYAIDVYLDIFNRYEIDQKNGKKCSVATNNIITCACVITIRPKPKCKSRIPYPYLKMILRFRNHLKCSFRFSD
ncbi:MAG: hypothetical protein PHU33_17855 [Bacteroidales bacterium]|nr:hypothetical protein [Bacteroidales bacterium]